MNGMGCTWNRVVANVPLAVAMNERNQLDTTGTSVRFKDK